ncbi:MAG: hypothetical protein WC693_01550 [Patescibacteria group bacterium]|jgi:hypothetical protein
MKKALRQLNKTAIIGIFVVLASSFVAISINMVIAATWQDPTAVAPNLGDLEPPINTSLSEQEKTGGLYVATQEGGLRVASGVAGGEKFYVLGSSYLSGDTGISADLNLSGSLYSNSAVAGSATAGTDLNIHNGLFRVDGANGRVLINSSVANGSVTVKTENEPGIDVENDSVALATIQGINGASGGTGIYGSGYRYGISAGSLTEYAVLADAKRDEWIGIEGGLYARGRNNAYGLVGRGLYGVTGFDNTEDLFDPHFDASGTTRAGLFEGSVDIIPSTGGNSDFVVDDSTLVVRSLTNKVGINTASPKTRLHVIGSDNTSSIYGLAGGNNSGVDYGTQTEAATAIYGESGTVTYSGAGTGWNFGVFGKAGDPGNGQSVGIMGVGNEIGGNTYAGWFDGFVQMNGGLSVTSKLKAYNTLTADSDINGFSNLNLAGTDSDINLTGTDGDIWLRDDISVGGGVEYIGKMYMDGGLPYLSTDSSGCNVAPTYYAEGTMFTCSWCASDTTRYTAIMVRMNYRWVNIGYDVTTVTCLEPPPPPTGGGHIWPSDPGEGEFIP